MIKNTEEQFHYTGPQTLKTRIMKYLLSLKKKISESELFRRALDEYLKNRGY